MQVALNVECGQDEQLIFAQQLGIDQVVVEMEEWSAAGLAAPASRFEIPAKQHPQVRRPGGSRLHRVQKKTSARKHRLRESIDPSTPDPARHHVEISTFICA